MRDLEEKIGYLFENTDDEHSINTNELICILAENGFSAKLYFFSFLANFREDM